MHPLDETDLEILRLLGEDARRPFSTIGDEVGLSGPAVSDRVTRLREAGVINGFTVDVDRSQLQAGVPVFVQAAVPSDAIAELQNRVESDEAVEHVFLTADGDLWFYARAQVQNVRQWIDDLFDGETSVEYSVTLIDDVAWRPSFGGTAFALTCAECGNTVDSEGESERIDGQLYHFCCSSCQGRFVERYDRFEAGA
ncbi:AsnC family transcriptional regulator [Halovivax cerinus]|uniref:AsnC family transcriptional regulator n=1 Tax=Halovivax cerinus TaxID=1487865 RepID=A0ABD5NLB6_9EURY|nr:AsnC family transcriptional regulator [Halovivax cerinus]